MTRSSLALETSSSVFKIYLENRTSKLLVGLAVSSNQNSSSLENWKQAVELLDSSVDRNSLQLKHDPLGRPHLSPSVGIGISISHTEELEGTLCFPSEFPMGLDLEIIKSDQEKIAGSVLSEKESQLTSKLPLSREEFQVLTWTMKEAGAKLLGTGFHVAIETFEIEKIRIQGNGIFKSQFVKLPELSIFSWIRGNCCFSMAMDCDLEWTGEVPAGLVRK